MEIALAILCLCLLVAFIVVLSRHIGYKKQIKSISQEVRRLTHDEYSQPIKTNYFTKDMTELVNSLNEHIKHEKELTISYYNDKKELSNIISGISHDFRTPLTASLGYLQLLKKNGQFTNEQSEFLDIITDKNIYLKELADDFFEISTKNDDELTLKELDLSNLLTELTLQQYSWIEGAGINAKIDIENGICVVSDTHSLKRIIDNLFSNCKKYVKSSISVSLKRAEERAVITISNDLENDNQIDADKIFLPFYRGASRSKEGSGLGLYICKALCDKMNAEITASINNNIISITLKI